MLSQKQANQHLQNTPPHNSRIHTVFKYTWTIYPDKTIFQPIKQASINLKGFKSYKVCSLITMELD